VHHTSAVTEQHVAVSSVFLHNAENWSVSHAGLLRLDLATCVGVNSCVLSRLSHFSRSGSRTQ
jgi:hypothetical protein